MQSGGLCFCRVCERPQALFSNYILSTITKKHVCYVLLPLRLAAGAFFQLNITSKRDKSLKFILVLFCCIELGRWRCFSIEYLSKTCKIIRIIRYSLKFLNNVVKTNSIMKIIRICLRAFNLLKFFDI